MPMRPFSIRPARRRTYRPSLLQIAIGLILGQVLVLIAFQRFAGSVLG
jgi:hypothetical protein